MIHTNFFCIRSVASHMHFHRIFITDPGSLMSLRIADCVTRGFRRQPNTRSWAWGESWVCRKHQKNVGVEPGPGRPHPRTNWNKSATNQLVGKGSKCSEWGDVHLLEGGTICNHYSRCTEKPHLPWGVYASNVYSSSLFSCESVGEYVYLSQVEILHLMLFCVLLFSLNTVL